MFDVFGVEELGDPVVLFLALDVLLVFVEDVVVVAEARGEGDPAEGFLEGRIGHIDELSTFSEVLGGDAVQKRL